MKEQLLQDFTSTMNDLTNTLSQFSEYESSKTTDKGSWNGGQVAEHIFLSSQLTGKALKGNMKITSRHPDEKVEAIKNIFLDFDKKMQAPDFLKPSDKSHNKTILLNDFNNEIEKIKQIIKNDDLTLESVGAPMPGMGDLTRFEWVSFLNFHTQRHIHQLKKTLAKVQGEK